MHDKIAPTLSPSTSDEATLELRLTNVAYAARDTHLYTFARPDGASLPAASAGSHITLVLPDGLQRQYSLVEPAINPTAYIVGVKKDPQSRGGSRYIHESLRVGTILPVLPPKNNFPLNEGVGHTVLIAGGIGVTPIYCMAQRLTALGRSFEIHYACRSRDDAALLAGIEAMTRSQLHFDEERGGAPLALADIVSAAPQGSHFYCCGPLPMLSAFEALTTHLPPECVHVEYFTAKDEAAMDGGYVVELARSGRTLPIPSGKSILHVLQEIGLSIPSSCEEGVCGACETRVISGMPDHRDSLLTASERASNTTMLICCSGAKSDRLVLDL